METIEFEFIETALKKAGAVAVAGVAADKVSDEDHRLFEQWLAEGANAGMGYMHNWPELRFDPRKMHEGTRYVITCAFSYAQNLADAPHIASYALGSDYHNILPKRIRKALRELKNDFSESARICVDSAPVRERYWAVRSGLATRCDSGLISIEGVGTQFFPVEILTPYEITNIPERKASAGCDHCGACRHACPGQAIREDGTVDARRCISYLTIEHRGEWSDEEKEIMSRPGAAGRLFGCEICQRVCHLNANVPKSEIPEFAPRPELLAITPEKLRNLTPEQFKVLTKNSPLKRKKF